MCALDAVRLMRSAAPAVRRSCMGLALAAAASTPAAAQDFASFGGLEARIGITAAQDASAGLGLAAEADLGYLHTPRLRAIVGLETFHAGQDRVVAGSQVTGSYRGTGVHAGVRWDILDDSRYVPYLEGGLMGENISTHIDNPTVASLLGGFSIGIDVGGGVAYALDPNGRYWGTGQISRVFIKNASHWNIQAGLRWTRLGRHTMPGGQLTPQAPYTGPQISPPPPRTNPPASSPPPSNAPPPDSTGPRSNPQGPPSAVPPSAVPPSAAPPSAMRLDQGGTSAGPVADGTPLGGRRPGGLDRDGPATSRREA